MMSSSTKKTTPDEKKSEVIPKDEGKGATKLAWYLLSGYGGTKVDEDKAVALLEERVKDGDGEAMWMLGLCNEYGMGTEQDIERAESLYKQSKDKGSEVAKYFLKFGWYGRGDGILRMRNGEHLKKVLPIAPWMKLDLESNRIGAKGALIISEMLKTNTTLTEVNLSYNAIRDKGAIAMSKSLMINATLTSLDLHKNKIGDEGAIAISKSLKTNTTLTSLDLHGNDIEAGGAIALSESLKTQTTLTLLSLWNNRIADKGAMAVSELLKTNTSLTELFLDENTIGPEGATKISESLKTNTTLTSLSLLMNNIGDEGAIKISESLAINTTLTAVKLSDYLLSSKTREIIK